VCKSWGLRFTAPLSWPTDRRQYDFSQALLERSRRIGGVDSVALSDHLPLEGGSNYYVKLRGKTSEMSNQLVESHAVSPQYFQAMGVRLLQGRLFTPSDIQTALALDTRLRPLYEGNSEPRADQTNNIVYPCVINESMARFFWPNQDPLGKMFSQGSDNGPWKQVIGVVNDVRQWGLTQKPVEYCEQFHTGSKEFENRPLYERKTVSSSSGRRPRSSASNVSRMPKQAVSTRSELPSTSTFKVKQENPST
jgi:hypothetical protein